MRLSTEAVDRQAAEIGIGLAYKAAGFAPPERIVWCKGPNELAEAWCRSLHDSKSSLNVKTAIVDRVHLQVATGVRERLDDRVRALVSDAMRSREVDATGAAVHDAVMRTASRVNPPLLEQIRRMFVNSLAARRRPTLSNFANSTCSQHDFGWLGAYEFFHDVCELKPETEALTGLWLIARHCGWMLPQRHVCWLSEHHHTLQRDARGRLHCATGPAVAYHDGWSVYAWKGVEVPPFVIEQPRRITLGRINAEQNVHVRRCMIEIMTPERFIGLGGADRVCEDETGVLWRKNWWPWDSWAAVEVINGTPEPNGAHKHYFLQVPPEMITAREAVAWTYGLSERQYSRLTYRT